MSAATGDRRERYDIAPVWHTCCVLAMLANVLGAVGIPKNGVKSSQAKASPVPPENLETSDRMWLILPS